MDYFKLLMIKIGIQLRVIVFTDQKYTRKSLIMNNAIIFMELTNVPYQMSVL